MSTTFTFTVISVSTLCSYWMNCYCLDHASIEFPCFKGAFSSSQFEFYLIVDSNCCRHVFKLATSKYEFLDSCIRVWAETRHETNTKNKKLFFCSLASPTRVLGNEKPRNSYFTLRITEKTENDWVKENTPHMTFHEVTDKGRVLLYVQCEVWSVAEVEEDQARMRDVMVTPVPMIFDIFDQHGPIIPENATVLSWNVIHSNIVQEE